MFVIETEGATERERKKEAGKRGTNASILTLTLHRKKKRVQ